MKDKAGRNRRKLTVIANEQEANVGRQPLHKFEHGGEIDHARFVDYE